MRTPLVPLLVALLAFCAPGLANTLTLNDEGIAIDDGAKGLIVLRYPKPIDASKKPIAIAEKKIDGQTATLKFEGGGQSVVDVSSGAIVVKSSNIPEGVQHFQVTIAFPTKSVDGLTWSTGGDAQPFPKEKAPKVLIEQGNQQAFIVKTAAGGKVAITIPPHGFQQLQDLRHFNDTPTIQWSGWINHYPEAGSFAINVGDAPAPKPAKTEMLAPAKPEVLKSVDGTTLLKWKDGKKAAFYLAFDDACPTDLTNVIPELNKRKFTGTFFVIAGGGLFNGKLAQWTEAAKSPYVVIANHTFSHKGAQTLEQFDDEVTKATAEINKAVPQLKPDRLIAYGKPGGVQWGEGVTDAAMKPILLKHNLVDRQPFWGAFTHVKTDEQAAKLIDAAIAKGETGHLDFHGVGGDWLACTMDFFTAFLDNMEKRRDELWVTDVVSAHQYAVERKGAELKVLEKGDKQIKISLTTSADPALYDFPLTLSTKVPGDWKKVQVTQGERKSAVEAKDGAAMYEAVPGATEIVLTPAE